MMIIGARAAGLRGLANGSVVVGFLGAWMSQGNFKPVPQMLQELMPTKKEQLHSQVTAIARDLKGMDIKQLTKQVMANKAMQEKLLE